MTNSTPTVGLDDLASTHAHLVVEWNDVSRAATQVKASSKYTAEWICSVGHTWKSQVRNRTQPGRPNACPACWRGEKVEDWISFYGLSTEWNDTRSPKDFSFGSHYRAQWKCSNLHTWEATIYSRTSKGRGCPACVSHVSAGEREVEAFIRTTFPDLEVRTSVRDVIAPKELDIYLPAIGLAFEYNGDYWHSLKPQGYHEDKVARCVDAGVFLSFIWESAWRSMTSSCQTDLISIIKKRLDSLEEQ